MASTKVPQADLVIQELIPCDATRLGTVTRGQLPRIFEGGGAHAASAGLLAKWNYSLTRTVAPNDEVRKRSAVSNHVPRTCESNTHANIPLQRSDIGSRKSLTARTLRGKRPPPCNTFLRSPNACAKSCFCGIAWPGRSRGEPNVKNGTRARRTHGDPDTLRHSSCPPCERDE